MSSISLAFFLEEWGGVSEIRALLGSQTSMRTRTEGHLNVFGRGLTSEQLYEIPTPAINMNAAPRIYPCVELSARHCPATLIYDKQRVK